MPGWAKALLITLAVILVIVIGAVVIGVVYVARNKDAWLAKGKEVMTEGRDFGRDSDNQGCVDQSVSRYKKEPGVGSAISTSLFMRACLQSSKPTPGFCSEVPRQTEFIKSAEWKLSQCRHFDLSSDRNCNNLFAPVQQFCEERARKEN
jgi:hypothetical protein